MTIAKEKISASLLYAPSSVRISGAVHLAVCPSLSDTLRIESRFCVTVARPKSVIRAQPARSTRIFDWVRVSMGHHGHRTIAYPLEVTMNYVVGVQVVKSISDITQLVVGVSVELNTVGGHLQDQVGPCRGGS